LIASGSAVVGISRSPSPLVYAEYTHHVADVATDEFVTLLAAVLAERGPFDACIYCAGIGNSFDVAHIERDEQVFAVNLGGALKVAKVVLPAMAARKRGHLIILSSQADELVLDETASYGASKAALSAYFEGVGLVMRKHGVAITNLRFGFVDTKLARAPMKPFQLTVDRAAQIVEHCLKSRPLRCTRPLRMAIVVAVMRFLRRWQIRLASG
jgi:short-subunit dehydrogenase